MSKNKLNPSEMGLVLSLDGCIKMAAGTIKYCESKVKPARSKYTKQLPKETMEFFQAIIYHLERLKKLDDNEKA
jgi:hypothetical protein